MILRTRKPRAKAKCLDETNVSSEQPPDIIAGQRLRRFSGATCAVFETYLETFVRLPLVSKSGRLKVLDSNTTP